MKLNWNFKSWVCYSTLSKMKYLGMILDKKPKDPRIEKYIKYS